MKNPFRHFISAVIALSAVVSSLGINTAFAEVTPNPVISRNCPSYSNTGDAKSANDEYYFSFCSVSAPDYIAYDLSEVPDSEKKQVIAVWYNTSAFDKIGMYANTNMIPVDYTIEVNKAVGGEYPEDNWEVIETVTGNTLASRQHLVDMEGYNWIRLNIQSAVGNTASVNFDIHNVSNGISDSWLFLGDSITAGGMNNCYGTGFATHINQINDKYFPIQENGGIGGIKSSDGKENIDRWLSVSQAKYVSIAYGTNDCWGNPDNTKEYYENTKYMIDAILASGKIPVLPKIPASTNEDVKDNVPLYNEMIDMIYNEYGSKIIHGVDFEEFFTEHPDYLSADGVHPNDTGYAEMRKIWAETMYERVYSVVPEQPANSYMLGDVNMDGEINAYDAVLVLNEYAGISTGGNGTFSDEQKVLANVNKDDKIDALDSECINTYYVHRLNGLEQSLDSWANGTDDGIVMNPLSSNITGDFTEDEIAGSPFRPEFEINTDYDEETNIINVTVGLKSDSNIYCTALGFVVKYDEKLQPAYDEMKKPIAEFSENLSLVNNKAFAHGYESDHQLAVSLSSVNAYEIPGNIIRFSLKDSDGISGKSYKFSIEATDGSFISASTGDRNETDDIMQAYLFTKGLASTSVTVGNAGDSINYGDANCDDVINIADATAIIQSIANPDKYALSEQGLKNADVDGVSGVSGIDALTIQRFETGSVETLPLA